MQLLSFSSDVAGRDYVQLSFSENIILWVVWLGYIAYTLVRGLKAGKYSPWSTLFMIVFSLWGVSEEYRFGPINSTVDLVNIIVVTIIAALKGLYLGKITIVEKIGERWYTHHTYRYIVIWIVTFLVKITFSRVLSIVFNETIPMWNMIWYVAIYYVFKLIGLYGFHREMLSGIRKETGR